MFNKKFPLWLPEGSVRSILALGTIFGAIIMVFLGIDVPEWYALLTGIVIRDYFQTRQNAEALANGSNEG